MYIHILHSVYTFLPRVNFSNLTMSTIHWYPNILFATFSKTIVASNNAHKCCLTPKRQSANHI